ncbi:MAG: hypothetical protein HQL55_09970 [Magnetococcales bacterium]|nr:hypothetical protein [Magnetococcales bacterium]
MGLAYIFVMWLIHDLGRDKHIEIFGELKEVTYKIEHALLGYRHLDAGHHHHVRHVHRASSVALAGLAAYISFWFLEGDTIVNLIVAIATYIIIGEYRNWEEIKNE